MSFNKLAPQVFAHRHGYTVQVGGRTTMEYIEGKRRAVVEVEFGVGSTCISNRIRGWIYDHEQLTMTDDEMRKVIERITAALRFDGQSVETSGH